MLKYKKIKKILVFLLIMSMLSILNIFNNEVHAAQYRTDSLTGLDNTKYPGYKELIDNLKSLHPNWKFTLLYTGLDWTNVIKNEYTGHGTSPKNLIYYTKTGEWICPICGTTRYDNGNWYCASEAAISYQMDPRNSINNDDIFQFERLIYVSGAQTREGVEKITSGTFMAGSNYTDAIISAANTWGVSPYFLAARLKLEQGSSGTVLSDGSKGVYNFFNINASGNTKAEIIDNAVRYATERGWTTIESSIVGGTEFVLNNYINKGQDTLYFQKFDVDDSDGTLYTRQYMQNVQAAQTEGMTVRSAYYNDGKIENGFTFVIPVYENMPQTKCPRPGSGEICTKDAYTVTASVVRLRSGAGLEASIIREVNNNVHMIYMEIANVQVNGYYWDKVMLDDGTIGYMARDYISVVSDIRTCNETLYATQSVWLRNSPRIDNTSVVTTLQKGQTVTRIDAGKYNFDGYIWDRVLLEDGRQGYVPRNFISTSVQGDLVKINANGGLSLREAASSSATVLETIPEGTIVTRLEKATTKTGSYYWDKILAPSGKQGYMAREAADGSKVYLLPVETTPTPTPTPTPIPTDNNKYVLKEDVQTLTCEPKTNLDKIKETYPEATATDANLGTGSKVTINGKEYTIIKKADVNGDGTIDVIDLALIKRHLMGTQILANSYYSAAILQADKIEVDVVDLALIKRFLIGTGTISL